MRNILKRTLIAWLLAWTAAHAAPQRIISTAPGITETLFAIGAGDRVVGVSTYCRYPPEALQRTKIGTYMNPDAETILSLRPDLVIVQKMPGNLTATLRRLKLKVVEVEHGNLEQTLSSIRLIGGAAGKEREAETLTGRLRDRLDEIRQATARLPRRSVSFVVGRLPDRLAGMVVVGRGSYLDDLFAVAGGVNTFNDSSLPYLKISLEQMLRRNPDVIIDMGDMSDTVGVTEEKKRSVVALWGKQPALKAVQTRRVYAVASDIFVVPGPRMVDAAKEFARMLHPELAW
jgi:iron complex transport system substrate-binding protein